MDAIEEYVTPNNIRLTDAFINFIKQHGKIQTFRKLSKSFHADTKSEYRKQIKSLIEKGKPGGEFEHIFRNQEELFDGRTDEKLYDEIVTSAFDETNEFIDAAGLVFAHSVLEELTNELLDISFEQDETLWVNHLEEKKFSIVDLRGSSAQELIQQEKERVIRKLKWKSLPTKCKKLYDICIPVVKRDSIGLTKYDPVRIKLMDDARHEIVHRTTFTYSSSQLDLDLDYMMGLCIYLVSAVCERFGLFLIPGLTPETRPPDVK